MTRDEYEKMLSEREQLDRELEMVNYDAAIIVEVLGFPNDGVTSIRLNSDTADVYYKKPSCSCCRGDTSMVEFPAFWLFTESGPDLARAYRAEKKKEADEAMKQKLIQDEEAKLAFEKEEFMRLKAKYEPGDQAVKP